ncbi:MAG: tRNA (N6-isopentenyl adenosine(37)-C2)-methylthiotransferase MiaB [Candidatus Zixiibacteriota bacterium]
MTQRYHIITYGCQMNVADSETLAGVLSKSGYEHTSNEDAADLIIVNTCSVRQKAEERAIGRINDLRRLKRARRSLNIAVVGCMAQRMKERLLERVPHVDLILGPDRMFDLPEILRQKGHTPEAHTAFGHENIDDAPPKRESPYSAYLTITRGCNNFCAFCIVPYVRGRERYHPVEFLVSAARRLADDGVVELTLLGQNVNSYRDGKVDFAGLIRRIARETDIRRIRYTSPHPKDLTLRLIETHAEEPKLMPHMHLPLQSGSDRALYKMARPYLYRHFRNMVHKLRQACPNIAVTTDAIVGFPTETEEDFRKTLAAFEEIQFDSAFMFHYSEREGTLAARELPDDVPFETKIERLERLIELQKRISYCKNQAEVGRSHEVLVDGFSRRDASILKGKTPNGKTALFSGDGALIGAVRTVRVREADSWTLHAELYQPREGYRPLGLFHGHSSLAEQAPPSHGFHAVQMDPLTTPRRVAGGEA